MEQSHNQNNLQGQPVVAAPAQGPNPLVKKIPVSNKRHTLFLVVGVVLVVVLGISTGWFLSKSGTDSAVSSAPIITEDGQVKEAGMESADDNTAEGMLTEGGIEGEGTHRLDRNSGPENDAYLTSTVVDLQAFVGKKVQVWGQTLASDNAPWLMDVSKIRVIEE